VLRRQDEATEADVDAWVTPLSWRMKPPERVRRIEIKSPAETPGLFAGLRPAQDITSDARHNLQRGRRPFTPPVSFLLTIAA
jgi:hypothetical protein